MWGVTASLVDDYLTIDAGLWFGKELLDAKRVYPTELLPTVRDPRLSQTVALPGQRMQPAGLVIRTLSVSPRWLAMVQHLERT